MLFAPKHPFSPSQDAEIRRVYEKRERGGNKRLAAKFGVSPSLISQRAAQLGLQPLQRTNNRRATAAWSPVEIKIVERNLHQSTVEIRSALAKKGYRRDAHAVVRLIHRKRSMGQWPALSDHAIDQDCYLVQDLMAGLGMSRDQLQRWIDKGWLPAKKWKGGDGHWVIRRKDLRRALRDYIAHWDHRLADKWFLIDLFYDDRPVIIQHSAGKKDGGMMDAALNLDPAAA